MMRNFARLALVGAVGLSVAGAEATTMWRSDLPELSRTSAVVVRGTVQHIQSRWSGDHMRILTDVDIRVSEALKGKPGTTVRVTQPGGQVGRIGQVVEGLASFAQGEDVVVFLRPIGPTRYSVAGMTQGKFHVARAPSGKGLVAVPEAGEAVLLDRATGAAVEPARTAIPLERLRSQVRAQAGAKAP